MAKKKYTYDFIFHYVDSVGYTLLTKEEDFVNTNTKYNILVKCPKGHVYTTQWGHFYKRERRCRKCKSHDIDFIRHRFKEVGYVLLSDKYENSSSVLKYGCGNGHTHTTTWNIFRNGSRCPDCVKTPYEEIVSAFDNKGYTVFSTKEEYDIKGAKFKFRFGCPNGHISSMNWYNFSKGNECGLCAPNRKKAYEEVKKVFTGAKYTLLSKEYVNNKEKLEYMCNKKHVNSMSFDNFRSGQRCPRCFELDGVSRISQEWLDQCGVPQEYREYTIEDLGFRVDGFDPGTNTVYEFLGDVWHGNLNIFDPSEKNPVNRKSYGLLNKETFDRFKTIKEAGYKVIYIWENDFSEDSAC